MRALGYGFVVCQIVISDDKVVYSVCGFDNWPKEERACAPASRFSLPRPGTVGTCAIHGVVPSTAIWYGNIIKLKMQCNLELKNVLVVFFKKKKRCLGRTPRQTTVVSSVPVCCSALSVQISSLKLM